MFSIETEAMKLQEFKSHFYHGEGCNLNNAGQALIPDVNKTCVLKWLDRFYKEGAMCSMDGWNETDKVRAQFAEFLGADVSELAFFQTTASALSQAALGIPLEKGDEILTWDQEYPSNFYPWRMAAELKGAKIIQVASENWETPAEKILQYVTDKTKVVTVSWVQYQTGSVTDLKLIAEKLRGRNIWLVADAIQGVGLRPFNFHECGFDIVCGGSHKWLCSSYGASYMLIKKDRLTELAPAAVGAMTYGDPDTVKSFTIQPKITANRFEPGSKAMIEIIALGATLNLFQSLGRDSLYSEACRVTNRLRFGIRELGHAVLGPDGAIINMSVQNLDWQKKIEMSLIKSKIAFGKRGPGVRLSPHAYTTDDEIDKVLKAIKI